MSDTKEDLRAEIARLREELAAEKARADLLQQQATARDWSQYLHMYPMPGAAPQPSWLQWQTVCAGAIAPEAFVLAGDVSLTTSVAAGYVPPNVTTYAAN